MYSVELYRRLQAGEQPVGLDRERRHQARVQSRAAARRSGARSAGRARTTCRCTRSRWPKPPSCSRCSTPTASSARPTWSPTATSIRRSCVTRSPPAARRGGVRVLTAHPGTRASSRTGGPGHAASPTDRGHIDCEIVVNCGGMFAAEIGRLAGVRVPLVPMSHQYLVTEPFLRTPRTAAADAARPGSARLLPAGGRRPADGRLRARSRRLHRRAQPSRRDPGRLQRPAAARRTGRGSRRSPPTPHTACRSWARSASARSSTARRPSPRTTSSASARPRSAGSSSPPASARTASPARAASAR